MKFYIEHNDGHNAPLLILFDDIEKAAAWVCSKEGYVNDNCGTQTEVLESLRDGGSYEGSDSYVIVDREELVRRIEELQGMMRCLDAR